MDLNLAGSTAYVTGGAQGIGAAIVDRLVAEGVAVAISDVDADQLNDRHRDGQHGWTVAGRAPVLIPADLSNPQDTVRAADAAVAGLGGPPTILVNNVGVAKSQPFLDISDADWAAGFDLNFMSAVRTSRALLPQMAAAGGGAVVIISSDLAKQPDTVPADYGAMKAALLYLSKALALEFAPSVRVNAVCPGPVWTGLWSRPGGVADKMAEAYGTDRDTAIQRYLQDRHLPLGIGQPDDVATLVAYLVSPAAKFLTGSAYDVGGTLRGLF